MSISDMDSFIYATQYTPERPWIFLSGSLEFPTLLLSSNYMTNA